MAGHAATSVLTTAKQNASLSEANRVVMAVVHSRPVAVQTR